MTQFVFLLFENGRVPVNSEERYKIEVHFSPGAKGREEIIASGDSISTRVLDSKKNTVRLKRMLPVRDDMLTENLSLSSMPSVKTQKRTSSKSLPSLMSKEDLIMIRNKISIFEEEEEESQNINSTPTPLLQNDTESQSNDDISEELCKFLLLLFQALI